MQILESTEQAYQFVWNLRRSGATVGLVPTMGALHDGHLSLVRASMDRCDKTLATIFVNPTQFAPSEDLSQYPRTIDADLQGLQGAGADAVFLPSADHIYPPGFSTAVMPPAVAMVLEGQFRPTHFQGVATVVLKLFNILPASHAFFGQKDYQQLAVIRAMVRDLNIAIDVVACPIVRDPDGLAMSSRNRYLSSEQRKRSLRLAEALQKAELEFLGGQRDPAAIEQMMHAILISDGTQSGVDAIDYATVVDAETLAPIDRITHAAVALIAARIGATRLIDNRLLVV